MPDNSRGASEEKSPKTFGLARRFEHKPQSPETARSAVECPPPENKV